MATRPTRDDQLLELLEICEEFIGHSSLAARDELDALLRSHGITGGPGWLIDMLSLNRAYLQHTSHDGEPGPGGGS